MAGIHWSPADSTHAEIPYKKEFWCFICYYHEEAIEQTVYLPAIWDVMTIVRSHCWVHGSRGCLNFISQLFRSVKFIQHYSDVTCTSKHVSWPTFRLFVQPLFQVDIKGNIRITGLFVKGIHRQLMMNKYYNDVTMSAMASQITGVSIVYSNVCSDEDQRKHQSSTSLAFVRGIHRWPVNFPHKRPVTRNMFFWRHHDAHVLQR